MKLRFDPKTSRRCLKTAAQLLIVAWFSFFPIIACAVMALHRLLTLLTFSLFSLLGERRLKRLGWLPQGHSLSTLRDKASEIWDEFLDDAKFLILRA